MSKLATFFVTKYALTKGILQIRGRVCEPSYGRMLQQDGKSNAYFHGQDWHTTLEEARMRASEMRVARIKALKRELAKLEALDCATMEPLDR